MDVNQRQIYGGLLREIARSASIRRAADDLVAEVLQHEPKLHGHQGLVFDDEDTRSHFSQVA